MTIEPGQSERCHIVCARVRFREICFQRAKKTARAGLSLDFQVFIFGSCGQVYREQGVGETVFVCLLAF